MGMTNTAATRRLEVAAQYKRCATRELDEAFEAIIDAVADALEAMRDATISRLARKARVDYLDARDAVNWLVAHSYAHTSGNGCWTHYHPGRGW